MIRAMTMAGGIAGAVALSQFPEFSQQYLQRLSGAVDELKAIAVAFDLSAKVAGLTREEALAELGGTEFTERLRGDMSARLERYDRLNADYQALVSSSNLERLAQVWRFRDTELARRTWEAYRPAAPVTYDGLICASIGFAAGWLIVSLLLGLVLRPVRRLA
jgi:DNA-binding transcriptional regulator YbjK